MKDICRIDGRSFDVLVTGINEKWTILYGENTGRVLAEGAPMFLEPIGTFFSHEVTFERKKNAIREYDILYELLYQPRDSGIDVQLAHNQTTIDYKAYVSQGGRPLKRVNPVSGEKVWGTFTVTFTPMEAQIKP